MIAGLNHITLAVQDMERSFAFYRDVLGFSPLVKWDQGAYFFIPSQKNSPPTESVWFCLNVDKKRQASACYTHYAFSVSAENFEEMKKAIAATGVTVFQENSSPGNSFYFLDPDGHKLEIHVGNAEDRILAKKKSLGSWRDVEWFV